MRAIVVLLSILGCGARAGLPVDDDRDAGARDAAVVDTSPPLDVTRPDVPPPPTCMAERGWGAFNGAVPEFEIDFPFVVAGIEGFGGHSCPRLFIRAGDSPTFDGAFLEIEVQYFGEERFEPGPREALLTVYPEGRRTSLPWSEMIIVDVLRADGLAPTMLEPEAWRAVAFIEHHDATTDLIGRVDEAGYCRDFAICI